MSYLHFAINQVVLITAATEMGVAIKPMEKIADQRPEVDFETLNPIPIVNC